MLSEEEFQEKLLGSMQKFLHEKLTSQTQELMRQEMYLVLAQAHDGLPSDIDVRVTSDPISRRIDVAFLKGGKRINTVEDLYDNLKDFYR